MPAGHSRSCVRTATMVRCDLWSEPESPPNRHHVALTPHPREASPPPPGDALAQPTNRGCPMMITQPAMMCLHATWQRLIGKSTRGAAADREALRKLAPEVFQGAVDVAAEPPLVA